MESLPLPWVQALGVLAQGGKIAPVLLDAGSDPAAQIHEVVLGEADDMEAVSDDAGAWEVALDKRAVACAHIDAHHANLMSAL